MDKKTLDKKIDECEMCGAVTATIELDENDGLCVYCVEKDAQDYADEINELL